MNNKQSEGKISFTAAVLMSINVMIGAGILYAVGPMTATADSVSFLGWPLIGLLLFPIIWSIVKAGQLFPGEGGFYHYCSSGLNPLAGFIAHWGYLLGYLGTAASLATVIKSQLFASPSFEFFQNHPMAFNLLLVCFYTLINLIAIEKISKIQSIATLLKITPILTVIALIVFYINPDLTFDISALKNIGMTVSTVIFAYWGFETCCSIGGLLKDGPQKVGSVIIVGFFATMALYLLFHVGLLYIMGPENLATYGAIGFPQFLGLSPTLAAALQVGISGAILFSWANSILGVSLGNITNIYFLAQKRLILGDKLLTRTNRYQRPIYAAVAHGIALFALVTFITDIDILFALTNFGVIIAFLLTLTAVFVTFLKQKNFAQLSITTMAFASCSVLIYFSWIKIPSMIYIAPLVIGILVGTVMFWIQSPSRRAIEEQLLLAEVPEY